MKILSENKIEKLGNDFMLVNKISRQGKLTDNYIINFNQSTKLTN